MTRAGPMLYTSGLIVLLFNAMNNQPQTNTALAEAFTKRLAQLGLSRRQFAIRSGLSRQTLHNIEIEHRTDLAPSTYAALDAGLRWPQGKAHALATGEPFTEESESTEERADKLRWVIVRRLTTLSLEELETMCYQWADNETEMNNNHTHNGG